MSAVCGSGAARANLSPGQLAGNAVSYGRTANALRNLFRRLWPTKTAVELAYRTESNLRHAERILAGERGISAETIYALLHTEAGWPVLQELMAGSDAQWWRELQRAHRLATLRRRQADLRRELDAFTAGE